MRMTKTVRTFLLLAGLAALLATLAAQPTAGDKAASSGKVPATTAAATAAEPGQRTAPRTRPTTGPESVVLPAEMDVPTVPVPPSPPLPPEQALLTLKVAPGFKVELVASEPLVQDPIAIHFDGDGRLWVCEMIPYMPHLDPGAAEEEPTGRISYLEDTNGDGTFDKKTVFLDKLVLPRACTPYRDGVLVAAPPYAWFVRDTDGDGKADERQLLASDYDNHSNPEHQPNGLMPALDNWIHNSQWPARFKYVGDARREAGKVDPKPDPNAKTMDPRWVRATQPGPGQWGITQDDVGRIYTNSNSDLLRVNLLPEYLLTRNPNYPTTAGVNQKVYADQSTYPIRATPGTNRAYQPGALTPDGKLRSVTAACAPHIYRGDLLGNDPQGRPVEGNAFICEPSANIVKREVVTDDGLAVKSTNAYDKAEFVASTDERFRPVFLADGPDGALYVCDLYRGILQHQKYITPYLRKQILMRDLEQPRHLGRIYRVVPLNAPKAAPAAKPHMLKAPAAELVQFLSHPAGWWRDMAQQQIVARNDPDVAPAVQRVAKSGPTWQGRLHALYTLEGLRRLNASTLTAALADADPRVRIAALRLAEPVIALDNQSPLVAEVFKLAKDERPEVRLAFLFTASTINLPEAPQVVAKAYLADAARPYVKDAVLTGLRGRELEFLQMVAADAEWNKAGPGMEALLGGLTACVFREGKADRVEKALALAADQAGPLAWRQSAMLAGLTPPADKKGPELRPVKVSAQPALLAALEKAPDSKTREAAQALNKVVTWPGKPGEKVVEAPPLTGERLASFERGRAIFAGTCAACHQPDGMGAAGKAANMHGSPFLLGPEGVPVRIVLHGLRGQVTIDGETADMEMPTLAALTDEQIADALTYVRREWGHAASPIKPETVAKVRAELKDRGQPWTREELKALLPPAPATGSKGKAGAKAGR